jgi:hypothetical protein
MNAIKAFLVKEKNDWLVPIIWLHKNITRQFRVRGWKGMFYLCCSLVVGLLMYISAICSFLYFTLLMLRFVNSPLVRFIHIPF